MKNKIFIFLIIVSFFIEIFFSVFIFSRIDKIRQDSVHVNDCVKNIEENFYSKNFQCDLEYTILDGDTIVYKSSKSVINSINDAILNHSTILDLEVDGKVVGKVLIDSSFNLSIASYKNKLLNLIIACSLFQMILIIVYYFYLNKKIIKPFKDMNEFAVRIAGGNLDIPLYMDRGHVFGAFTEAFDLMRNELKTARINEKKANDEKREMVAKLSHDIKTPVASIKAVSEIGFEKAKPEDIKNYFNQINVKTDQIKVLVDNLFNSSVSDITEIDVNASNYNSKILSDLIHNSDYFNKLNSFEIPNCNVFIDRIRMQQVFDNIINNSYKYAKTKIDIDISMDSEFLKISFRDYGEGVSDMDLPLLKEKFKRGRNVKDEDGAGLGLHLANYFMEKMNGHLELSNSDPGFKVEVFIRII